MFRKCVLYFAYFLSGTYLKKNRKIKFFFHFVVDKVLSLGYYKTVMIIITFVEKIFITMRCYLYAFDNE